MVLGGGEQRRTGGIGVGDCIRVNCCKIYERRSSEFKLFYTRLSVLKIQAWGYNVFKKGGSLISMSTV